MTQSSENLQTATMRVEPGGGEIYLAASSTTTRRRQASSSTFVEVPPGLPEEGGLIVQEFEINPFSDQEDISSTVVRVGLTPDAREQLISACERRLEEVPTLRLGVNFDAVQSGGVSSGTTTTVRRSWQSLLPAP